MFSRSRLSALNVRYDQLLTEGESQKRFRGDNYVALSGKSCAGGPCSGAGQRPDSCSFSAAGKSANQRACAASAADHQRTALPSTLALQRHRLGRDLIRAALHSHGIQNQCEIALTLNASCGFCLRYGA